VKALLCTLFLLAGVLQAEIDPGKFACSGTISGSATYVLNQGITGVAGSTINLSSALGAFVTVTGTASSIDFQFSGNGLSGWETMFTLTPGTGSYCVPKLGPFMRLVPSINSRAGARTSAYYYPVDSAVTGGGASAAAQATTNALLGSLTQSAGTDQTSYNSVSTVAAYWLTQTASDYLLTHTAGLNSPLLIFMNAAQGGAGIKYHVDKYPTMPLIATHGWYNAATTTVQVTGRWGAGHYLHVISVGATAVSGTVDLVQ
jgi:hypothetical protein